MGFWLSMGRLSVRRGADLIGWVPMAVTDEVEWVPGTEPGLFNWATWIC